jgi:hypothetical protein
MSDKSRGKLFLAPSLFKETAPSQSHLYIGLDVWATNLPCSRTWSAAGPLERAPMQPFMRPYEAASGGAPPTPGQIVKPQPIRGGTPDRASSPLTSPTASEASSSSFKSYASREEQWAEMLVHVPGSSGGLRSLSNLGLFAADFAVPPCPAACLACHVPTRPMGRVSNLVPMQVGKQRCAKPAARATSTRYSS